MLFHVLQRSTTRVNIDIFSVFNKISAEKSSVKRLDIFQYLNYKNRQKCKK